MAVDTLSGSQGLGSGVWVQLQQQQAQRTADQAATRARILKSAADEAQAAAEQAKDNARTKRVDSDKAQTDLTTARSRLDEFNSVSDVQSNISDLRKGIEKALSTTSDSSATAGQAATPVVNAYGQTTGSLVNVVA